MGNSLNQIIMIPKKENGFYTVVVGNYEVHFFAMWQVIAFLANINMETQRNKIMTFSQLIIDLRGIYKAFDLGELISYVTDKHSLIGYEVARFETTIGNFEYIYKQ
jgi:hypothetical protein